MAAATDIEKENLEAHVELCAQRYDALEKRLTSLENSVGTLKKAIEESHLNTIKVLIGTAGTIVASVVGLIVVMLQKL